MTDLWRNFVAGFGPVADLLDAIGYGWVVVGLAVFAGWAWIFRFAF